jgi:hypothetical protein
MLKRRVGKQLKEAKGPAENRHSDNLNKSQLTLFQGLMKKEDIIVVAADDEDDEVRTSVSQNRATATLCSEEFFLRTQYILYSSPLISAERHGGRQFIDG